MKLSERVHDRYVQKRRADVLRDHLAELIPRDASALDVGCGDGLLAYRLMEKRPDLKIRGIDVLVRETTFIPVEPFDGQTLPCGDAGVDVVMFIDVLHHTEDPMRLLREGARAAGKAIVIKDHALEGVLAGARLRFMDRVSNARYGVQLPYNYWPERRWFEACDVLGLRVGAWRRDLRLYPRPFNFVFGGSLHFVARLDVAGGDQCSPGTSD